MNIDDHFAKVAPEVYNRLKHPSLKQYHDFVAWLRETTIAELSVTRTDKGPTRAALIRFFKRGLGANLLLAELMEMIPSILQGVDWPEADGAAAIAILKALTPADLGIQGGEGGIRFGGAGGAAPAGERGRARL